MTDVNKGKIRKLILRVPMPTDPGDNTTNGNDFSLCCACVAVHPETFHGLTKDFEGGCQCHRLEASHTGNCSRKFFVAQDLATGSSRIYSKYKTERKVITEKRKIDTNLVTGSAKEKFHATKSDLKKVSQILKRLQGTKQRDAALIDKDLRSLLLFNLSLIHI